MKPREQKNVNYIGPSMNPTLEAGDELLVIPYGGKKIRRGDVIVFLSPEGGRKITHRVISVDSEGIRTRGDNNNNIDPWVLHPHNIIGRVIYAQKRGNRRRIFGAPRGQLYTFIIRSIRFFDTGISFLLRPVYHRLSHSAFLTKRLNEIFRPRILLFNRPEGMELQLVMGHRLIGRLLPGKAEWQIQRPFRLFVNLTSLPQNPAQVDNF